MTVNEIKRLRIGFKSFEPSVNATPYAMLESLQSTVTFALEESSKGLQWVCLSGASYSRFAGPLMYGYRQGCVYEAEVGTRLVQGKKLSAEGYIVGLNATAVVDLASLPGVSLAVQMTVEVERRDRLMQDDHFGYIFDAQTCSLVEVGDKLHVSVPIVTHNNLMLALFMWTSAEKQIHLTVNEDIAQERNLGLLATAPISGETMGLF